MTFKEAKVIKSRSQEVGNCIARAACILFLNPLYRQAVRSPAHGTIFYRAQSLSHHNDGYVTRTNHYHVEKLISTGNKHRQS